MNSIEQLYILYIYILLGIIIYTDNMSPLEINDFGAHSQAEPPDFSSGFRAAAFLRSASVSMGGGHLNADPHPEWCWKLLTSADNQIFWGTQPSVTSH